VAWNAEERETSTPELISRTTRGLFRDLMTNSTVGRIGAAFQDEGFAPSSDCTYTTAVSAAP